MRSIERRFYEVQHHSSGLSSLMSFIKAIRDQGFTLEIISKWFNRLVDKEDYDEADRRILLRFLYLISNPEDDQKQG